MGQVQGRTTKECLYNTSRRSDEEIDPLFRFPFGRVNLSHLLRYSSLVCLSAHFTPPALNITQIVSAKLMLVRVSQAKTIKKSKKFKRINKKYFDTPHYIKKETLKEEDRAKDVVFVIKYKDWGLEDDCPDFEKYVEEVLKQERKKVYNTEVVYEWINNDFYKQTKRKAKRSLI